MFNENRTLEHHKFVNIEGLLNRFTDFHATAISIKYDMFIHVMEKHYTFEYVITCLMLNLTLCFTL